MILILKFSGIVKRAKNDDEFHCIPCNEDISLATSGKTFITKHLVTDKHKKSAKSAKKVFEVLSAEEKWQRIFKANLPGMYRLVSKFLCIPASNAFVESRENLLTDFCSMDRCSKQAECGDGEVTDSSESQFRFVLSRIFQNANFQQETAEIDNRWPEIQHLNVYLPF